MKHTRKDLTTMQAWPLSRKIQVTQAKIMEWYMRFDGNVFLSFSGGIDSTALLDMARRVYEDIPAVFVDTGLEYPELRDFVGTKENVTWLRPKHSFNKIIEKYGYPVISKEISDCVDGARKGQKYRIARLNGEVLDKNGNKSRFNHEKWRYLLDAPFKMSANCCYHMKKAPIRKHERSTKRWPIIGTMAEESQLRTQSWLKLGCNAFDSKRPISRPISFWRRQDILRYLQLTNIPYAPIYGDIVPMNGKFDTDGSPMLKTTGVYATGCMFCMYGIHLEPEPNRFQMMQSTHPKQYDYCINKLGCGEVLDWLDIPYETQSQLCLFDEAEDEWEASI